MQVTFTRLLFVAGLVSVSALIATPAAAQTPDSIWSSSISPPPAASDAGAVELGVRFRSDVNGFILGLRFYKDTSNGGTHIGNLWTNSGALLATATFSAESASGWQLVTFAAPVAIAANTTYVASYHTNVGHYTATNDYFAAAGVNSSPLHAPQDGASEANGVYLYGAASGFPFQTYRSYHTNVGHYAANSGYFVAGVDNPPLHALADGVDGPSGIYRYGDSAFPTDTYFSANYWVDVVFSNAPSDPPTVVSVNPANGATAVSAAALVTATFNEPMNPAKRCIGSGGYDVRPRHAWTRRRGLNLMRPWPAAWRGSLVIVSERGKG